MCPNRSAGGVDFYAQAWRIWPRAALGLRWGPSGAPGGVREGFRSSFWGLRRSFWNSRELILDSSKVIFELPRVILATKSRFETHFGNNGHDFCARGTDSEPQLLRCFFLKLQFLHDPRCQRSSDSGPACLQDLARYPWWGSAFGVGGRGRSPIEYCSVRRGL